jgi:hypothetical protein
MSRRSLIHRLSIVLMACLSVAGFTHCQLDPPAVREERYVTVRLNDSLKRYDSVEIAILVAGDTGNLVGKMWSGALNEPGAIPSFKLDRDEERPLTVRVRGFDSTGALTLDMLISKEGGTQTVVDLPMPIPSLRLAALQVSPGALTPPFDSTHSEYRVSLTYAESTLYVSAIPGSKGAELTLDASVPGSAMTPGKAWDAIPLKVGDNPFHLKVSARSESGSYTLIATRAAKSADSVPDDAESEYKGWKYHRNVDIKANYVGFPTGTVIRDFPLLVRLTKDNFDFTQAGEGGKDVRVSTADGKPIAYEIAHWEADGSSGRADLWVALDTVRGDDDSARVVLHSGNDSALDASDGAKVFDAGKGFSAAWHFNETAKGAPEEFRDAAGRYHGMGGAGNGLHLPGRVPGVVGYGQEFKTGGLLSDILGMNGQSFVTMPRNFDPGASAWTFQVWIDRSGNKDGVIFDKGDAWSAEKQRFQIICLGGGANRIVIRREGAEYPTNVYLPTSMFNQLGVTYDGERVEIYVDGIVREGKSFSQGGNPIGKATFGTDEADGSGDGFKGTMDEPWFSDKVRSPEWLRFAFETQKPNSSIVVVRAPK